MKMVDINKQFTEKVNQYLLDGWIINSTTMSGHQGEIAKVDFVKDDTLVRIWLGREYTWSLDEVNDFYGDMVFLRVGKWNRPAKDAMDSWSTVWMNHLEVLEEIIFYEISKNQWYVDSIEEAMECQTKHRSRYKSSPKDRVDITSEKTQEIASKYLKNHKGYQRVSKDHIKITKITEYEKIRYRVNYHGGVYYIG